MKPAIAADCISLMLMNAGMLCPSGSSGILLSCKLCKLPNLNSQIGLTWTFLLNVCNMVILRTETNQALKENFFKQDVCLC